MTRRHLANCTTCWCKPILAQACDDCDGDGCWKCEKGLVPVYDEDEPIIIIHRDEEAPR